MGTSNNVWQWSSTAGSNSTSDAGINWAEGQAPSTVNDSARGMMAAVKNFVNDYGGVTTTGTANAYSVTTGSGFTALATGLRFSAKINLTNTSTSTINVDGLGAKSIRKFTSSGESALAGNELVANGRYDFIYDTAANSSAGGWVCLNPTPSNASTALSNLSRLYGSSASSTTLQEITLGSSLSMSGSTLSTTMTSVTAGNGLTGGGSSGAVNLDIGAGNGITVASDSVAVTNPIYARALWAGSSGTVADSSGVTSVTRNSTGLYTVVFSFTFGSVNWQWTMGLSKSSDTVATYNPYLISSSKSTTQGQFRFGGTASSSVTDFTVLDFTQCCLMVTA